MWIEQRATLPGRIADAERDDRHLDAYNLLGDFYVALEYIAELEEYLPVVTRELEMRRAIMARPPVR